MLVSILFLSTCFLAYSNGANDNFKGVATLFGSKTANYKVAIAWATITTFLGSISSIFFASTLLKNFSGKGLVPDVIASAADFHTAVAIAGGLTVILATLAGFPISTTHALTGALVGAGLAAIGPKVNIVALGESFVLPLLLSPIFAILLGGTAYGLFRYLRVYLGTDKEWLTGVGESQQIIPIPQPDSTNILKCVTTPDMAIDTIEHHTQRYCGKILGVKSQQLVDALHFFSAGIVSFARGLNDTPKIVALLLIGQSFAISWSMFAIAGGMALGGLLNAKRVAITMSHKITGMNHGQGLTANLVTGMLVIAASRYGLPVSTTHVAVGSIFGMGLLSQQANVRVFYQILLSWVLTLPTALLISGITYLLIHPIS
jgi:inorganic phosphate transporter, PiT family